MRFVKKKVVRFSTVLKVNQVHWQGTSLRDFSRAEKLERPIYQFAHFKFQIANLDFLLKAITDSSKVEDNLHFYLPVKSLRLESVSHSLKESFMICGLICLFFLIILIFWPLNSVARLHLFMLLNILMRSARWIFRSWFSKCILPNQSS